MVCNGTSEVDWQAVLELARQYEEVVPCFGLHPWFVKERSADWVARLEGYLNAVPSAVGEIGLDRWVGDRDEAAQEEVFGAQLRLAHERKLPVMIHCLRAWGRLLEILDEVGPPPAGMLIHSFGGAAEMIPPLARMGAVFSFAGNILQPARKRARRSLPAVPRELFLLETDAPALPPPEPFAPFTIEAADGALLNEPANLPAIAEGVAELRGESPDDLVRIVWQNARRLLGDLL